MHHVAVIVPPACPAAWFDLAKAQCREETNDHDQLIWSLLETAMSFLDGPGGWLNRCLMPQTLELRRESFYHGDWRLRSGSYIWEEGAWLNWNRWPLQHRIELPFPPFISLTSIIYEDQNGVEQTLTSDGWTVDPEGDVEPSWGNPWPLGRVDADGVRIRYQAGYPLKANGAPGVPASIRHAVMLLVSHWYANPDAVVGVGARDSSTELPLGVRDLLAPLRIRNV